MSGLVAYGSGTDDDDSGEEHTGLVGYSGAPPDAVDGDPGSAATAEPAAAPVAVGQARQESAVGVIGGVLAPGFGAPRSWADCGGGRTA